MSEGKFKPLDYDPVVDSLFVRVPESIYERSVMLGDLILDLGRLPDKEGIDIIGFELLDASKKFGIKKDERHILSHIKQLQAEITVQGSLVKLKIAVMVIQHRKEKSRSKIIEVANAGLPSLTSSISV